MKHISRSWRLIARKRESGRPYFEIWDEETGHAVCTGMEFISDANLISSAPDLLEACKDLMCLRLAEPDDEEAKAIVGYIKYAIAKAQGETK